MVAWLHELHGERDACYAWWGERPREPVNRRERRESQRRNEAKRWGQKYFAALPSFSYLFAIHFFVIFLCVLCISAVLFRAINRRFHRGLGHGAERLAAIILITAQLDPAHTVRARFDSERRDGGACAE